MLLVINVRWKFNRETEKSTAKKKRRKSVVVEMTSEEELSRLTLKLDSVKEKFIKEWTGESFETAQQQIKDIHINSLKEGKGWKKTVTYICIVFLLASIFEILKATYLISLLDNITHLEQLVKEYQDQSNKKLQGLYFVL